LDLCARSFGSFRLQTSFEQDKLAPHMNRDELLAAAEEYAQKARQWFRDAEPALREKEKEIFTQAKLDAPGLKESVTDLTKVVLALRTHQADILNQLRRGFHSQPSAASKAAPPAGSIQVCLQAALLAIESSIKGWLRLTEFFPDQEDTVLSILVELGRLQRAVQTEMQAARNS